MWKSVSMLSMFGFKIQYISTDGAQSNRDLFKLLVPAFNSASPQNDAGDERLSELYDVMEWFDKWEKQIKNDTSIKNKEKHLISHQTREDIVSSLLGFEELCKHKLKKSHGSIIPS